MMCKEIEYDYDNRTVIETGSYIDLDSKGVMDRLKNDRDFVNRCNYDYYFIKYTSIGDKRLEVKKHIMPNITLNISELYKENTDYEVNSSYPKVHCYILDNKVGGYVKDVSFDMISLNEIFKNERFYNMNDMMMQELYLDGLYEFNMLSSGNSNNPVVYCDNELLISGISILFNIKDKRMTTDQIRAFNDSIKMNIGQTQIMNDLFSNRKMMYIDIEDYYVNKRKYNDTQRKA